MTIKPVEPGAIYNVPSLQPSLFKAVEGTRLIEDEVRAKSRGLKRDKRCTILLDALNKHPDTKDRVLEIIDRVKGNDEAFRTTLDTLAYARRRDAVVEGRDLFTPTMDRLESCIKRGSIPIQRMKDLLEVGMVFDAVSYHLPEKSIQMERNWINGGERSLDGRVDIEFPLSTESLVHELQSMGISRVHVRGDSTPVENADKSVLMGIYASRIRSVMASERKAERLLTKGDW